ncbi:MAG: Cof-type HAD-IIB family hydrolase [Negativicutes bacterium]|nr:Cof-type HAD-IIB family hydrolase [Negativicutes bacterium]
MLQSDIQLVAIDLDGTLLDDNKRIPSETVSVIHEIIRQGIRVTVASARTFGSVLPYARQLGTETPLITFAGAYVADIRQKQILVKKPLNLPKMKEVVALLQERDYYIKVYAPDRLLVQEVTEETIEFSQRYGVPYEAVGRGRLSALKDAPFRIVLLDEPERIQEARRMLEPWEEVFYFSQDTDRGLEITDATVNKGAALGAICREFAIPFAKVMAIGNEGNDIEMIRQAGIGVAMANACEELKQCADVVTKSNEERGVEWALRQYVLNSNGSVGQ